MTAAVVAITTTVALLGAAIWAETRAAHKRRTATTSCQTCGWAADATEYSAALVEYHQHRRTYHREDQ